MAGPRLRVAFVITALDVGGAQTMLLKLLSRIDRRRFEPLVISLSAANQMLPQFLEIDVPCECLNMRASLASAGRLLRLSRVLRNFLPDVVQGWMYHANLAASAACAVGGLSVPVLWNIRATLIDRADDKPLTAFLIWMGGKLSFLPKRIINNSTVSAREHEQRFGYRASKTVIIPNGFDTAKFRPSWEARLALRRALGIADDALVVGLVARHHPMKDHGTFLRAAELLAARYPQLHFVLVGEGVEHIEPRERVHRLGARDDVAAITAALDIAVSSSSSGEGFPNAVGEALSCGVPCVVTDVGDSAMVVGDAGRVVPRRDPDALARAVAELVDIGASGRAELGERARRRVVEHFSLEHVVREYERLYSNVYAEYVDTRIAAVSG